MADENSEDTPNPENSDDQGNVDAEALRATIATLQEQVADRDASIQRLTGKVDEVIKTNKSLRDKTSAYAELGDLDKLKEQIDHWSDLEEQRKIKANEFEEIRATDKEKHREELAGKDQIIAELRAEKMQRNIQDILIGAIAAPIRLS